MRLPYNKSFKSLTIVGMDTACCHATKDDLVRVYFKLSEPPPLGWSYIFTTVWRSLEYPLKRQTGVERDAIWLECIPSEVATGHLQQLEEAVAQTCAIYRREAQEQARDQVRRAQLHAELRSKLEALNQSLYPEASPANGGSIIARCLRFICRGWRQKRQPPARRVPVFELPADMRDYHHSRFNGAALAPDGRSLSLDYFDHDQGGTRFCFRYVLSASAPPRLVSGYTHEHSRLDYEIPIERIPHHVFSEARDWLKTHLETHQDTAHSKALTELQNYLQARENVVSTGPHPKFDNIANMPPETGGRCCQSGS